MVSSRFHQRPETGDMRPTVWSLNDHSSARICFPTWLARYKDNGRAPTADGELTV